MINEEKELPRGDIKTSRSMAFIPRSDNRGDIKTSRSMGFPPTPFLLVANNSYFVVESWKESITQALGDYKFMQDIIFEGHDATTEEIEKFSVEEDNKAQAKDVRRESDEK